MPFCDTCNGMQISWLKEFIFLIVPTFVAIVAGPFGTYEHLPLLERSIYWIGAMIGVGAIMSVGMQLTLTHPGLVRSNYWFLLILVAAFCALPGLIIILTLENVFRNVLPSVNLVTQVYFFVFVIGALISAFKYPPKWRRAELLHSRSMLSGAATLGGKKLVPSVETTLTSGDAAPTKLLKNPEVEELSPSLTDGAAFLRRLNPGIGRQLITIRVRDHYLEVTAKGGPQTLLMRMIDAERELEGYPGMRVHRSHWISFSAVERITRQGNKWTAHLMNNIDVPVSRSEAQKLREALDDYRAMNRLDV